MRIVFTLGTRCHIFGHCWPRMIKSKLLNALKIFLTFSCCRPLPQILLPPAPAPDVCPVRFLPLQACGHFYLESLSKPSPTPGYSSSSARIWFKHHLRWFDWGWKIRFQDGPSCHRRAGAASLPLSSLLGEVASSQHGRRGPGGSGSREPGGSCPPGPSLWGPLTSLIRSVTLMTRNETNFTIG